MPSMGGSGPGGGDDPSGGASSGNSSNGGGLGGGSSISGGMSPDAKEGSIESGYGIDSRGRSIGNDYRGSWENVVKDKEKGFFGHPGSGGYAIGGQGVNDGKLSIGDMSGLGLKDKAKVGLQVAKDNPGKAIGGTIGFALGGLPGLGLGYKVGDMADKAISGYSMKALSHSLPGVATAAATSFGTPATAMGAGLISKAIDPDTKLSSHIAGLVGAGLGGAKLGGKYGAMAGAQLGQVAGNLAPAGSMNPANSDLSNNEGDISGADGDTGQQGSHSSVSVSNVAPSEPTTSAIDRAKSIQQAGQWNNYQDRFHKV